MAIKARLKLVLMADDVVVAESEDTEIWQAAFQAIQGIGTSGKLGNHSADEAEVEEWVPEKERIAIRSFGRELGVEIRDVLAACHPRLISPYIFPSKHHWEAFKRHTPERGRTSVSNAVLSLTLLLLWAEKINLERVFLKDGLAVLRTIATKDEHARRAVENCSWIRYSSGGRVTLNPDEISKAIAVAHAFCLQEPPRWEESAEE